MAGQEVSALADPQHTVVTLIDNAVRNQDRAGRKPRPHLGASMLGHECDRWLWLSFRWAVEDNHEGRLLRLFRRGQREEEVMLADLELAGLTIVDTQVAVSLGGHVAGTIDAIVTGVPEAPEKPHVAEFKTHNARSFANLLKEGVEKAKPMHYVQMQVYMHATGLDRALYLAVCKDDDRLYSERVRYDRLVAEEAVQRAKYITASDRLPDPMYGASAAYYVCKMCPGNFFCHTESMTNQVHCRTCAHFTARADGTSHCAVYDAEIPYEAQVEGCDSHVLHPNLVVWNQAESPDGITGAYRIEGEVVLNGAGGVSSRKLVNDHWTPF